MWLSVSTVNCFSLKLTLYLHLHFFINFTKVNMFVCLCAVFLVDLTAKQCVSKYIRVCALHVCTHTCASLCVHATAQWLLLQAAWHWFDIQRPANIMRPVRGQWADADRWPRALDLGCYCNGPMVGALKGLEETAHWLLCVASSTVSSGDQEAAEQWEGSWLSAALWRKMDSLLLLSLSYMTGEVTTFLKCCPKLITIFERSCETEE